MVKPVVGVYGIHVSYNTVIVSLRYNMLPIFYEDGKLHKVFKLDEVNGNKMHFTWSNGDRRDAWLRLEENTTKLLPGGRLEINGKIFSERNIKTPINIGIEPVPGGFIFNLNEKPDPGREPPVTAIWLKRVYFKKPKTVPSDVFENMSTYKRKNIHIYLSNRKIYRVAKRYTAISHVGGSMFVFTRDPTRIRSPFIQLRFMGNMKYDEPYEEAVILLPLTLAGMLGFGGYSFHCMDLIQDAGELYYLRLGLREECGR